MLLASACATKPFNVKPRRALPPGGFTGRASAGTLELEAAAIRDEDFLSETFDANVILAGLLPVKLSLQNGSSQPVDLTPARFWLRSSGKSEKPMEPRRVFKRLMRYYKIRLYNPEGYKEALGDLTSYDLNQRRPLAPGESRWGILFFEAPAAQPATPQVLLVTGIGPGELRLKLD